MNILMILTNPFTHDPRVYNEAKSLIKAGHNVTVFAWDNKRKNSEKENINGINIVRSYNIRFLDFLPFDLTKLHIWWVTGYHDAVKLFKNQKFDIIYSHDLDGLIVGLKLKKKFGLPLIYDSHEFFGYMMSRMMAIWKYYNIKEKRAINNVDNIIVVNEPLKQFFEKITDKPIDIIMNAKPLEGIEYKKPDNKIFTLLYAGSIGKARFLLELIDVVNDIENCYCIIAGGGEEKYVEKLEKKCKESSSVDFLGRVEMQKVISLTKKADAVVCMTDPKDPNNSRATANKQFEAMVSGRPIICTKETYPGYITEKEKVGILAEYTKQSLKQAILKLKNNPKLCKELGRNALKKAIEKYNWEKQEEKLLEIIPVP